MTYNDILALAKAGYNAGQIGQLAQLEQMQPAPAPAPAPAPSFDYNQMMAEILGIKQAVQAGNIANSQQPAAAPTAEQILANIIAPKPIKKEE